MPHSLPEKEFQEEKSLHTRAALLRTQEAVLNAFRLPLIITSTEGAILSFNGAAEALLGYSADEVIGKTAPVIVHDTDEIIRRTREYSDSEKELQAAFDIFIATAEKLQPDPLECTFIRKNGSRFPGSLTVVALRDELHSISGYAGMINDLTERKELHERLAASEKKFRLLAENIPGAIYLCHNDEQYSFIFVNDQIEAITGYPPGDFISRKRSIADLFHPDDRQRIYDTINQSVVERKGFYLQYRVRHADGQWRWISENGVGVYEGDQLTMLEGFLQDITAEKAAEENLQRIAEENLRFFNNPVNLNAISDLEGRLQRISPSWSAVLGWTEEELKSKPVFEFVHPADLESTTEALRFVARTRKVSTFENRFRKKDGSYQWLLWGMAADHNAPMIYASAIDISARKASEENILNSKLNLESVTLQLQEQNRRLDEFAHIISHNLRAPVSNIQALINLLDEKSEIQDYKLIFEKLKNVSKNLGETMNELMDTLKAKTQPHVDRTEIRFKEVLDKVVQSLEGELIVAQASVTFDFNEAPVIYYSKAYLESIFQNLLTNAIKYKSPHRKPVIHFRSTVVDQHLELQVSDNGQGIDMEKFGDKIFGLHKTFHEHHEARGVGLFLVKTQVEALGGTISVSSEVDKGTIFTIRFGPQ